MFERFNEQARRALFFSRFEASRLGERLIDSEHILLGILREGDGVTVQLWRMLDVEPEAIRKQFPTIEERVSSSAELPISESVKKILTYAGEEADNQPQREVQPYHLLLGMLRLPECRAAALLTERGVEYETVAQIGPVISHALKERAEAEARTPITLRQAHYELLDRVAATMQLAEGPRANREGIVLAIMDAMAASRFLEQEFTSLEDVERRLRDALTDSHRR